MAPVESPIRRSVILGWCGHGRFVLEWSCPLSAVVKVRGFHYRDTILNRRGFNQGITVKPWHAIAAVAWAGMAAGCSRQPERFDYTRASRSRSSSPTAPADRQLFLTERCGTPQSPRLLGGPEVSRAHLKQGAAVYARYCVQCHGVTGDGKGRGGGLHDAQAPRLSPRDLQVHLDDLRGQAAPRGPAPDGPARRSGARRCRRSTCWPPGDLGRGRRLCPGADPPRRARSASSPTRPRSTDSIDRCRCRS